MQNNIVTIVGAGLAGCEAAWQLATRGCSVRLYEMKPQKKTPAHSYPGFAELVCSNSFKSDSVSQASGLLKEEMRRLNSIIMRAADNTRVPAGTALAVDRRAFSDYITEVIHAHENIKIIEQEIQSIPREGYTIIATGPLTADALADDIVRLTGAKGLHFFDAAAPVISAESIDYTKAFFASRYGNGTDYLNCVMDKSQYESFLNALLSAECAVIKDFEKTSVFEGCMPIEVMAARGRDTIRFGPLKPVGITEPHTGNKPYAVVQLRKENERGSMFNIVGFQTHLKFSEQKRVFSMIPGLENMEILRYGIMHRNSYIHSPKLLDSFGRLKSDRNVFFAGQITGVEGYMESAANGLHAGIAAAACIKGSDLPVFTDRTAIGALMRHVSASPSKDFQPMNINFGIMEGIDPRVKDKKQKASMICERSLKEIEEIIKTYNL
jgi:methylenetetrahydrofolate--tRNA-(uracil-5-)-methyltransferase